MCFNDCDLSGLQLSLLNNVGKELRERGCVGHEDRCTVLVLVHAENGDVIALTADKLEQAGEVPHGTVLVDQTGAIVSNIVVKDRVLMAEEGLVAVVLTIDKKAGSLLTSPDIISRGFIYMREQEELMTGLRAELRRAVQQRFKRILIELENAHDAT